MTDTELAEALRARADEAQQAAAPTDVTGDDERYWLARAAVLLAAAEALEEGVGQWEARKGVRGTSVG